MRRNLRAWLATTLALVLAGTGLAWAEPEEPVSAYVDEVVLEAGELLLGQADGFEKGLDIDWEEAPESEDAPEVAAPEDGEAADEVAEAFEELPELDLADVLAEEPALEAELSPSSDETQVSYVLDGVVPDETVGDDGDRLFEGYFQRALRGMSASGKADSRTRGYAAASVGRATLSGVTLRLYDVLLPKIRAVAAGSVTSTEFTFDSTDLRTNWYSVSSLQISDAYDANAGAELMAAEGIDTGALYTALLLDCPYDLYWFDKTMGWAESMQTAVRDSAEEGVKELRLSRLTISMCVAQDYAAEAYRVNDRPARVAAALDTIGGILRENAGLGDLDKLNAYADAICRLTDYDHDAADDEDTPYGDPWQLVNLFDGDEATKVVCEGYAKALKYLIDLSDFQDDVGCALVMGELSGEGGAGGSGAHMWNVVSMPDGRYYLADLTNCDAGDHCSRALFLKGCATDGEGNYACNGLRYAYYDYIVATFGADNPWLKVSSTDYGVEAPIEDLSRAKSPAWQALQAQIDNAADGEIVALTGDVTASGGDAMLAVPAGKRLTLDLAGHTLNRGLTVARIDGHALVVRGDLTIADSVGGGKITGGWDSYDGGGVSVAGGSLTLAGGAITGNRALYGGGVGVSGSFRMTGGSVNGNIADASEGTCTDGGGVCVFDGSMELSGGEVSGNLVKGAGGGVAVYEASFTMSGGKISGNRVTLDGHRNVCFGGGVYASGSISVRVSGGEISGNLANGDLGSDTVYTVYEGSYSYHGCSRGGGMYVNCDDFTMTGGVIANNTSPQGGGVALDGKGLFTMKGGRISGNRAASGGGVYLLSCQPDEYVTFVLEDGEISGNIAAHGGGVCLTSKHDNAVFTMKGGSISGNTTRDQIGAGYGGGVSIGPGSTFTLAGGSISGNEALQGGGVEQYSDGTYNSTFTITGGEIRDNHASDTGGGVYTCGAITMSGGSICDNIAGEDQYSSGGGVYMNDFYGVVALTITGGSISGNQAGYGGGIHMSGGTLRMSGGSIRGNQARSSGGGVKGSSGLFTLSGGSISDNAADSHGGGVSAEVSGSEGFLRFVMTGGSISGNTAATGGGAWIWREMELSGGEIIGNHGGGIDVPFDNSHLTVSGAPRVTGNDKDGVRQNVNLSENAYLIVGGALGRDASIGISLNLLTRQVFTRGLGASGNLKAFFGDGDNWDVDRSPDGTEAAIWGNIRYTASGYSGPEDGSAHCVEVSVQEPWNYTIMYGTSAESCTDEYCPYYQDPGSYVVYYKITAPFYRTVTGSGTVVITPVADASTPEPEAPVTSEPVIPVVPEPVVTVTPEPVIPVMPEPAATVTPKPTATPAPTPTPTPSVKLKKNATKKLQVKDALQIVVPGKKVKGYKSSDAKIAKVSKKGLVTAKAAGTAKITVTLANKKTLTLTVKVTDPNAPTKVTLKQGKSATLKVGKKLALKAVLKPAKAKTKLTWKTSNKKIAAVSSKGVVTAKAAGTAKITVTTANGKSATIRIKVTKK